MSFLYFLLAGALGGVLAGMGMGGGTLTMPILVLLLGVSQLTAQFANLLSFLPSGAVALTLHAKNGYLQKECVLPLVLPAAAACLAASLAAPMMDQTLLKRLFGAFLVAVAAASLISKVAKKS